MPLAWTVRRRKKYGWTELPWKVYGPCGPSFTATREREERATRTLVTCCVLLCPLFRGVGIYCRPCPLLAEGRGWEGKDAHDQSDLQSSRVGGLSRVAVTICALNLPSPRPISSIHLDHPVPVVLLLKMGIGLGRTTYRGQCSTFNLNVRQGPGAIPILKGAGRRTWTPGTFALPIVCRVGGQPIFSLKHRKWSRTMTLAGTGAHISMVTFSAVFDNIKAR